MGIIQSGAEKMEQLIDDIVGVLAARQRGAPTGAGAHERTGGIRRGGTPDDLSRWGDHRLSPCSLRRRRRHVAPGVHQPPFQRPQVLRPQDQEE